MNETPRLHPELAREEFEDWARIIKQIEQLAASNIPNDFVEWVWKETMKERGIQEELRDWRSDEAMGTNNS